MEVFVKIIAEDLKNGECNIAAIVLLTFVALAQQKRPTHVPEVILETEEQSCMELHRNGQEYAKKENKTVKS